jgi:hypothetical protein
MAGAQIPKVRLAGAQVPEVKLAGAQVPEVKLAVAQVPERVPDRDGVGGAGGAAATLRGGHGPQLLRPGRRRKGNSGQNKCT